MPYTLVHEGLVREFRLDAPFGWEGVEPSGPTGRTVELASLLTVDPRGGVAQPMSGTESESAVWSWQAFRFRT